MKRKSTHLAQRYLTLFVILTSISFSILSEFLPIGGNSVAKVAGIYQSPFIPAAFTFGLWGIIYVAFAAYGFAQLSYTERHRKVYDRLNPLVIAVNILAAAWILAFRFDNTGLSLLIVLAMVACGFRLLVRIKQSVLESALLTAPFSLFLSWMIIMALANISVWLISLGWRGVYIGETSWNSALLGIALVIAVWICLVFRDWLFPLVTSWSFFGIWSANLYRNPQLATSALIAAIALMVGVAGYLMLRYYSAVPVTHRKIKHSL